MGMLGSVLLLLLAAVAAEAPLVQLRPGLRPYLSIFSPFSGPLGVTVGAYGVYLVAYMLAYLGFVRYAPAVFLTGLASGLVCLSLGLVFGLPTARLWAGEGALGRLLGRAAPLSRLLARYQTALGVAGVVLAFLSIALNIFI